jgi:hypothetical protein
MAKDLISYVSAALVLGLAGSKAGIIRVTSMKHQ